MGKVTAEVHTESYRGPVEKEVTVTSDDPTRPVMSLRIKLNIVGSVEILPRAYMTMPTPPDMDYKSSLVVRKEKSEKGELKITEATASVPWIKVSTRKVEKAAGPTAELPAVEPGDYVIDAVVTDESQIAQSGQQIRFNTGLPREPSSSVPISIAFQPALNANPPTLVLMALDGAKEASGTVSVSVRSSLAKQPVTSSVTPQAFSVKLDPDGDRRYKATVNWKSDGQEASQLGWVTFMVAGESIRVPVRVRDKPMPPKPGGPPVTQEPPANGAPASPGTQPPQATSGNGGAAGTPAPVQKP